MASFNGKEILDALLVTSSGKGRVAALRLWEAETILAGGFTEAQWCRLLLAERIRKVVSHKLSQWLQLLETERELQKLKAKGAA